MEKQANDKETTMKELFKIYKLAKARQQLLIYFIIYAGGSVATHCYFYGVVRQWSEERGRGAAAAEGALLDQPDQNDDKNAAGFR